jgi:hypothetical protein
MINMDSGQDYEIEIWVKRSTAELLKKFRDDFGFVDNDEALISLIKKYNEKN